MKQWLKMTDEEMKEAIILMVMEADDFNRFSDATLHMMYNDLYCLEDDRPTEYMINMTQWLEDNDKEALLEDDLKLLSKHLDRKYDANQTTWDNMEFAYDKLEELRKNQ